MSRIIKINGDGIKSINPWDVNDNTGWTVTSVGGNDKEPPANLYGEVAWAFRAVQVFGRSVPSVPFDVLRGDEVIDTSSDWRNTIGVLPDPFKLLSLIAQSRAISGCAYIHKLKNKTTITGLRYMMPNSVAPVYDKNTGNKLVGFKRAGIKQLIPADDMIACWYIDPTVEIGVPNNYPMRAAFSAVGALASMNKFVTNYFERGAIKETVFVVDGNPTTDQVEDMENYLGKMFGGIKQAFKRKVFQARAVNPVVIGDGLESLSNATLTKEMREDISNAFSIPQTILFSTGAGGLGGAGVVKTDRLALYRDAIVPEINAIFADMNAAMPDGIRFVARPETMDIFQEDESERSVSVANYTNAIATDPQAARIAMSLLGVEMTDETQAVFNKYEEVQKTQPIPQKTENAAADDLKRWQKKSLKSIGKSVHFESDTISHALNLAVRSQLPKCKTADDVRAIFAKALTDSSADRLAKALAEIESEVESLR